MKAKKDTATEIEERKVLLANIPAQLTEMRGAFLTGVQPFVATWMQTITRQYVTRNPEKILKLGSDRLKQLKTKVEALCGNVEPLCREVFSQDEFWPETRDLLNKNQLGIRIVLGKLGTILEEYGLVKTKAASSDNDLESWNQYDCSGDRQEFDGTPVYPHSIDIPGKLQDLLEDYRILVQRKSTLQDEIKHLEFEGVQAQATKLWDSL